MVSFNIFGKKNQKSNKRGIPYALSLEWVPYKLFSGKKSSSTLFLKIKNVSKEDLLTSVVMTLPQKLSFDSIGVTRRKELKIGELKPNEEKEKRIDVMNSIDAQKGEYTIQITATSYYRDYEHIINSIRKKTKIQIV